MSENLNARETINQDLEQGHNHELTDLTTDFNLWSSTLHNDTRHCRSKRRSEGTKTNYAYTVGSQDTLRKIAGARDKPIKPKQNRKQHPDKQVQPEEDIEDQQLQEPSMSLNAYRHHHQMSAIQLRNSKNSGSRVKKKNPMRNCWKYTLPLRKAKRKPKSQRVPQTTLSISGQKTPHGGDMFLSIGQHVTTNTARYTNRTRCSNQSRKQINTVRSGVGPAVPTTIAKGISKQKYGTNGFHKK